MIINAIGVNYTHSNKFAINRPNGSGDFLFLHIKTPAVFILDGKAIIAEKNSIIVFKKGTPQLYSAHGSNYVNDFIHFDAVEEHDLKKLPLNTLLPLPSSKQINKILKDIYLEHISNNVNRAESMDLQLKLLFVKVNELVAYKPQDTVLYGYYDALLNLRSLIYRYPEERWSVTSLSNQVNLSPSHFQRLYKQTFGTTCIADVIACKIQYAKASLASTSGTIREISALCGYDNEEHFMRQFKSEVGLTPSEYRNQIRG